MVNLRCPDDGHVLQPERESVPFWWCRHCSGLWLPRESTEMRGRANLPPESEVAGRADAGSIRSCPACAKPLSRETSGEVVLDVCDECGGVWLDPGEYPAALRRAARQRMKRELPSLAPEPPGPLRRILDTLLDLVGESGELYVENFGKPRTVTLIDLLTRRRDSRSRRNR